VKAFVADWLDSGRTLAILAGHYCVAEELVDLSASRAPEEASFVAGVDILITSRARGAKSRLTVWVNDIGIEANARRLLKEQKRLPDNYRRILEARGVDPSTVDMQFESSTRNKASTHVKKLSARDPCLFRRVPSDAEGLVRCVEACGISSDESKLAYVIDGPEGEALVVKDGPNPKCNMILATLFDDACKSAAASSVVTVFNGIYVNRIQLGMFVASRLLGLAASFANLYTFDDYTCGLGETVERRAVGAPL
jgi:hypothetical protein